MHATKALDKQIERYRQMTGGQRLSVALDLHQLSCDVAREGIRRANPAAQLIPPKWNDCFAAVSSWPAITNERA